MLKFVLLALMSDGKPAHGYALMKAYEERSGLRVSIGNIYRELQRLLAEGSIVSAANPPGADPRRTPYAITAQGRQDLASWLSAPAYAVMRVAPDPICHRLVVAADVDAARVASFLDDLHGELWSQTKAVERERALVSQRLKRGDRVFPTRAILLGRRAKHLAADIEMIEEMRSLLQPATRKRRGSATPQPAVAEGGPRVGPSRGRRAEGHEV